MEENQVNNQDSTVQDSSAKNSSSHETNQVNDSSNTNDKININTEDLKRETSETVKQVKETFKNADLKNDSKEVKGFITSFFKDPLGELKKVTSDSGNKFFKISIIVLAIWLVAILISNVFGITSRYLFGTFGSFSYFFRHLFPNILNLVKDLIAPVITVSVLSGLVYGFKKNKNRSFLSIASSIFVAKIPVVAAVVLDLLTIINSSFSKITNAFSGFCNILSTVLLYFAIKNLSDEEKNASYFWKFALIMGIFYIVKFVFSYLGIYL